MIDQGFFLNTLPFAEFIRIMTLRSGPQVLPYSVAQLARVLVLYLVTGLIVLTPGAGDLFTSIVLMVIDLVMLVVFIKFCLYTRNASERFHKTFLACLGVGTLFQLLALPLVFILNTGPETSQASNVIGGLFYLLLISWQVTVMGHILRHAMNMMLSLTVFISFVYFLLIIFISEQAVAYLAAAS